MTDKLKAILAYIYGAGSVADSLKGYLNVSELVKVALPVILHGGGTFAVLTTILGSADAIFAAPYAAIGVAVLTAIVQVLRQLGKGEPTPASA
jgi:uncharacterized membrane protein YuzA (DUF378 family)